MAAVKVEALFVLVAFLENNDCQNDPSSVLSLSHTHLTVPPNVSDRVDILSVRCGSPGTKLHYFKVLHISRVTRGSPKREHLVLASLLLEDDDGKVKLKPNNESWSVSGSLRASSITLTIPRPSCSDGGMYICLAIYTDPVGKDQLYVSSSGNVSVEVTPGKPVMEIIPNNQQLWMVDEEVILQCSGPVGCLQTPDQWVWQWQYKASLQSPWLIHDPSGKDTQLERTNQLECYFEQTVSLRRKLQVADTGRYYRCVILWMGEVSDQYATSYYVGTVIPYGDFETVPPSRLTVSQTTLTIPPNISESGVNFIVTCEPPASKASHLHSLTILRVPENQPFSSRVPLVFADTAIDSGKAKLETSGANWRVGGSIDVKSISLTIWRPYCGEAGSYICIALLGTPTGRESGFTTSVCHVQVVVTPGQLSLEAIPHDRTLWKVNKTLTIRCSGPVGSLQTGDQNAWVWQYSAGSPAVWLDYDGPPSDIKLEANIERECYREQTSTLRKTLQLKDTARVYRCAVRWNGTLWVDHALSFPVGAVTMSGHTTNPGGNSDKSHTPRQGGATDNTSKAMIGIVAGSVGGSLLVIVVVIVIYCVLTQSRQLSGSDQQVEKQVSLSEEKVRSERPHDPARPRADHYTGEEGSSSFVGKSAQDRPYRIYVEFSSASSDSSNSSGTSSRV